MSGAGGLSYVSTYLSIVKDEAADVATFAKSDPATKLAVANFEKQAPSLTTPTALLKNYQSLQLLLDANNLGSDIDETGVLKDLLTQDPTSKTSLLQKSGSTDYLHFTQETTARTTVQLGLGDAANLALNTSGASASVFTLQNTAFAEDASKQTATNIANQWNFVLNDGTADAGITKALSAASGGSFTYTINPAGTITGSYGAPPVSVQTKTDGTKIYTINAASNSAGTTIRQVSVVSVPVSAGTSTGAVNGQISALVKSMHDVGLDASRAANGSVNIVNSITPSATNIDITGLADYVTAARNATSAGATVLALGSGAAHLTAGQIISDNGRVVGQVKSVDAEGRVTLATGAAVAVAIGDTLTVVASVSTRVTTTEATTTSDNVLAFGAASNELAAGQVIRDGSTIIGTIKSIDAQGNVTLTSNAAAPVAVGDTLAVLAGASTTNVGYRAIATAATLTSGDVLALGSAAAAWHGGQTVTDGNNVIGVVQSVASNGNVTLTANAASPVSQGDALYVSAAITSSTAPGLEDPANVQSIINQYETSHYEQTQGQQQPGMQQALEYNRKISAITTIPELMQNRDLLSVALASIGLDSNLFGELDFNRQTAILTKEINLSKFQDPKYVAQTAERYLTLVQANQPLTSDTTGIASLFNSFADPSAAILTTLFPGNSSSQLPSTTSTTGDPVLSLFV